MHTTSEPSTDGLPPSIDDITPAWLGAVLGTEVAGFEAQPLGAGTGFVGQLARLRLTYAAGGDGPPSVIVKLPSLDPAVLALAVDTYRFYERELGFYRHLGADVGVPVPGCLAAIGDGTTFALVLEDLMPAFTVGDQVAGGSLEEAERALRTLAALHARWWEDPQLATLDWMPWGNDPVYVVAGDHYPLCWPLFADGYGHLISSDQRAIGEALVPRIRQLIEDRSVPPFTINHGDYRLDNLFFPVDGDGPCAVIDWQIASKSCSGALDVAYFLSANLEPAVMREHFGDLLGTYHDQLCRDGVRDYPFSQLEADLRVGSLACLAYPVLGATILDTEDPRGTELFHRLIQGYFGLAEELGAGDLL